MLILQTEPNIMISPVIGVLEYTGAQKSMHFVTITNQ